MQISKPLERQIQGFQFKIQQAIAIQDEKINRLSETLVKYKSKIMESKEEIERIEHEIELAKYTKESIYRCNRATYERKIAMKKAQHNELIQSIQKEQADEIDEMQRQFSEILNDLENQKNTAYTEQFELIEKKKESTLKLITQYQSTIQQIQATSNQEASLDDSINLESVEKKEKRIQELQNIVKQRNEERLQCLLDSKDKLQQCMSIIEKMDKEQESQTSEKRKAIDEIERRYHEELDTMTENHKAIRTVLKQKLEQSSRQYNSLKKALSKLKYGYQQQLKQTLHEMTQIKERFTQSAPPAFSYQNAQSAMENRYQNVHGFSANSTPPGSPTSVANYDYESDSIEKNRIKLRNSKRLIREKEEDLDKARQENLSLKQEIGRLKHHIKYAQKMQF